MSKQKIINTIDMISWLREEFSDEYNVHDRYDVEPGLPIHLYCTKGEGKTKESLVIIVAAATEINKNYFDKLCFSQSYLSLYPYMSSVELKQILAIPYNAKVIREEVSDEYGHKQVYSQESYAERGFGLLMIKAPTNKKGAEFKYIYQPTTLRNRMEEEFRKKFGYLFSVKPNYKQYLKDGNIDNNLKNEFKNSKQSLSNKAEVSKTDEKHWEIVDSGKRYIIEDTDTKLNIYDGKQNKAIARFFNKYIDEAVVGIAGTNPVKFEERGIDRKLLELIATLKDVSYAEELRQIANDYLGYDTDDYSFAKKWIGGLWAKYFSISYPDMLERLEPMLKELYPKYRDHFLHQFQVFLLGSKIIDYLIRSGKLKGKKEILSKGWLLTSTFHDFAQAIQKYDDWTKTFFDESLEIKKAESLELKRDYVENTFSSSVEHIISSLEKCFCDFDREDHTDNRNKIRHFFYHQITDRKNHGLLSGLSLLKRFKGNDEFHTTILPSATAIAIHDDDIWQPLNGVSKEYEGNERIIELCRDFCTLKPLPKLKLDIQPLSFLLILCDNIQDWGRHFKDSKLEESSSAANAGLKSISSNGNKITIQLFVDFNTNSLDYLKYKVDTLKLVKALLQAPSPHFLIELWDREKNEKLDMDVEIGD